MTHTHERPAEKPEAKRAFFERESTDLIERNRTLAGRHAAEAEARTERRYERLTIISTCMDERAFGVEEAYGLLPGEAEVYASGGGKIDAGKFGQLYGKMIEGALQERKTVEVYLTPHECREGAHLGCAAFKNDTEAQKAFFGELKLSLEAGYPGINVHVLAIDTSTDHLRRVDVHPQDEALEPMLEVNEKNGVEYGDAGHAGYGIYVGDAYRAWVPERNAYFRLSAMNPDIAGNADIALTVMGAHSNVDLSEKPIILQIDYPIYEDAARTEAARRNIDAQLQAFLAGEAAKEKLAAGDLRVVKTETDMRSWNGKIVPEEMRLAA